MKTKLCAAIIGKNESGVIEKCLRSLIGFDEIYFTDTGSTDDTVEKVRRFTYKVSFRKWDNSFSNARNFNLKQIPRDAWVFSIDCDEWLPKGEVSKIKKVVENAKCDYYLVETFNQKNKGHHKRVLLYKNNVRWKGPAHNYLPVRQFCDTNIRVFHVHSPTHQVNPKRTLNILLGIKKPSPRELYLLGREWVGFGKWKKALDCFEKYAKVCDPGQEAAEVFQYAGHCLFQLGKTSEAQDAELMAIKLNPNYKEAFIAMAAFSNPREMFTWARYGEAASNFGVLNIDGNQEQRLVELKRISVLALQGKKPEDIFKGRIYQDLLKKEQKNV